MASTNGLQGAPSNLTNTIDGLTYLYANGQEITGLYINSQTSTSAVNATIILDPAGQLQVQNSVLAPIFTINNTNITSMYQAFTNILTTPNINAYGDLNLNISNNTLTSVVKIIDADGVDLVRTGYFAYGGTFGNKGLQLNSVPLVVEAGITGTVLPETITDPNWEQIRILNTNVADIFTSICCDGVGTYFITTDTTTNAITDKPNYAGRTNFYLSPDQSTNFQGNINSNGTFTANGDLSALGTSVFSGISAFKNDLSFFNPLNANPYLTQLITTNDYSLDTSHWDFFNGVNFATKWNDTTLPFSNVRMMNGNKDPTETAFNSFFDIKVEGKYCYFYFSPTTTSYYVDAPTLEVMNFQENGTMIVTNDLVVNGTFTPVGGITLSPPLTLTSSTASEFIILTASGTLGTQSCLIQFQMISALPAYIGLYPTELFVNVCPYEWAVYTNASSGTPIIGLAQLLSGKVVCNNNLSVTGDIASTTLHVSGATTTAGITNTSGLTSDTITTNGLSSGIRLVCNGRSTFANDATFSNGMIVNTSNAAFNAGLTSTTVGANLLSVGTGYTAPITGYLSQFKNNSTQIYNIGCTSSSSSYPPGIILSGYLSGTTYDTSMSWGYSGTYSYWQVYIQSSKYRFKGLTAGTLSINSNEELVSSSDERIKNSIEEEKEPDILNKLSKVQVSRYKFNDDAYKTYTGFIAQNVETIFPNVVDGKKYPYQIDHFDEKDEPVYKVDENGEKIIRPRGFDNTAMTAYTVLAVQELTRKVAQQQEQIEQLLLIVKKLS